MQEIYRGFVGPLPSQGAGGCQACLFDVLTIRAMLCDFHGSLSFPRGPLGTVDRGLLIWILQTADRVFCGVPQTADRALCGVPRASLQET